MFLYFRSCGASLLENLNKTAFSSLIFNELKGGGGGNRSTVGPFGVTGLTLEKTQERKRLTTLPRSTTGHQIGPLEGRRRMTRS